MTRMMAEEAGVGRPELSVIDQRAKAAEDFVARSYGGLLRRLRDPVGDVDLRNGRVLDAKSVWEGFTFVNGGAKQPLSRVVVVAFRYTANPDRTGWQPRLVGTVEPDQWRHDYPVVPGRTSRKCWFVYRDEVAPLRHPWEDEDE